MAHSKNICRRLFMNILPYIKVSFTVHIFLSQDTNVFYCLANNFEAHNE